MRLHLTARGSDPTPPACANSTAHGCPGAAHDSANSPDSADAPMKQDISKLPMDSPGDGNGESEDPSNEINDNDVTKVKPIIIWDSDEKLEDACKAGEMKKCKDQREKNKGHRDFQIELHFDVCMSNTQGLGKRGKGFYDLCWYEKGIRESLRDKALNEGFEECATAAGLNCNLSTAPRRRIEDHAKEARDRSQK